MKDAARLLAYFIATLLLGALLAPVLFWSAQALAAQHLLTFLAGYDFEKFFHRALLIAALVLLWPLLRSLEIRKWRELGLAPNPDRGRDLLAGFLLAFGPLLCCGAVLLGSHQYEIRNSMRWSNASALVMASIFVPVIEELFFRGFLLGILLRSATRIVAIVFTSAVYAILHFLKSGDETPSPVRWTSGFVSIANSFGQFSDVWLVAGGFSTLFLLGYILADARIRRQSLALPIGLHGGWIFGAGLFSIIARAGPIGLPWVGKSLLVGIVPLSVGLVTWLLMRAWLDHVASRES